MHPNKYILLVEDDDIDAMTVRRALRDVNATFLLDRVTNGEEGLHFLRDSTNHRPGLILLDLNMPRMNGIEFLVELKTDPALRRIPVVVLTTSREDTDRLDAFDNCIGGYMVKPVDYEQFVKVMEIICEYWTCSEKAS
ncbi:MAG: response regulator [Nitrosomonas sp.]|uniref:response regulator n=1 Tax=Nitrosomonas sp. TaxID=42353 RepID=UPI002731E0F4|nr:response regulator [Nitrosomonas sp.]MDP1549280.1 response regulator [Nitrosomonas sp.]